MISFVKTDFQLSKDQKPEVRPRSQESRPRSASRTKAKSPLSTEERLIPPSQRRKRKSNQDEDATEESEKENENSPEQKKQKVCVLTGGLDFGGSTNGLTDFSVCAVLHAANSNIAKAK